MILLDTHVLLWMALQPAKLSKRARAAIVEANSATGIGVAAITLLELAWMAQNGRVNIPGTVERFVRETTAKTVVLPITVEIAARAVQLPSSYPKDPQDRLIGATALVEGIPLITADERIRRSGALNTIW